MTNDEMEASARSQFLDTLRDPCGERKQSGKCEAHKGGHEQVGWQEILDGLRGFVADGDESVCDEGQEQDEAERAIFPEDHDRPEGSQQQQGPGKFKGQDVAEDEQAVGQLLHVRDLQNVALEAASEDVLEEAVERGDAGRRAEGACAQREVQPEQKRQQAEEQRPCAGTQQAPGVEPERVQAKEGGDEDEYDIELVDFNTGKDQTPKKAEKPARKAAAKRKPAKKNAAARAAAAAAGEAPAEQNAGSR